MTIDRLAVIGAGFMGSGIAEAAAAAGVEVTLYEPEQAPLERSRQRLRDSVARAVEGGKRSQEEADALVSRISYTSSLAELEGADAAVEAVFEDVRGEGRDLPASSTRGCRMRRFLASNTSSIPIAELAAVTTRPERVVGLHFFSPVPVMKLVEVVVALDSGDAAVAAAEAFATQIAKQPIRTKDRAGFVVNMLLVPYLMAGVRM